MADLIPLPSGYPALLEELRKTDPQRAAARCYDQTGNCSFFTGRLAATS